MQTLDCKEIENVNGGDSFGVAAAGLGGFGGGFTTGAAIGSIGGPFGALTGGLIGGFLGTVGGVYAYFEVK